MIIKYLIQGAIIIINWFLNSIMTTFSDAGANSPVIQIANGLQTMLGFCQQANNFCYLLLGDTMYVVIPIVLAIIGLKYTVLPVFIILRHHIPIFKGGR